MNSLIFISDSGGGAIPEWERYRMVLSTPSCIAVCCYPEQDGPTEITIGRTDEIGHPTYDPAFDGELDTPRQVVRVSTVDDETVLELKVPSTRMRVRIWLSHPRWPCKVFIGVG